MFDLPYKKWDRAVRDPEQFAALRRESEKDPTRREQFKFREMLSLMQANGSGFAADIPEIAQKSFAANVANGSIPAASVVTLIHNEEGTGAVNRQFGNHQTNDPAGASHPETIHMSRLMERYIDALGDDARSQTARQGVVDTTLEQAMALRNQDPPASAALFGIAANAMGSLAPEQVERNLQRLAETHGPAAVAQFAAGAAAGLAQRALPGASPSDRFEAKADGLAQVIKKVDARSELGGQLLAGAQAFASAARGQALDLAVVDPKDERTGLRAAMSAARDGHPAEASLDAQHPSQPATLKGLLTATHVPAVEPARDALEQQTKKAVEAYNADPTHHTKLPAPAEHGVSEWSEKSDQRGVVLQLGPDDYVISGGRGTYQHFESGQVHDAHPEPEKPAVLSHDGTVRESNAPDREHPGATR
jgi:hypothetical protein